VLNRLFPKAVFPGVLMLDFKTRICTRRARGRTVLALECRQCGRHSGLQRLWQRRGGVHPRPRVISAFAVASVLDAGGGLAIVQMAEDPHLAFAAGMN
jgi:hypothetical protein